MGLHPSEIAARNEVIEEAMQVIHETLPDISTDVYGSHVTGLALPMSDVDIRVHRDDFKEGESDLSFSDEDPALVHNEGDPTLAPNSGDSTLTSNEALPIEALVESFKERSDFTNIRFYSSARAPLLAVTHARTGMDVQIVAGPSTKHSQEVVRTYLAQYPNLKALYSVVKTMFDMRDLTDVYNGGFGSYSIFMMIIASLAKSGQQNKSIGQQLLDVLDFIGNFDTINSGISVEPPMNFPKRRYGAQLPVGWHTAALRDPVREPKS